jgi:hypothetical protein
MKQSGFETESLHGVLQINGGSPMNRKIYRFVILLMIGITLRCAAATAQRLGGYKEIDKADEGATAAAEFAVKAESEKKEMTYKLVSLEHAESQVVAGINYRLCLKVGYHKQDDDVDTTEFVRVVVYRNLQNQYSLTSWTEENCGSDERGLTAR